MTGAYLLAKSPDMFVKMVEFWRDNGTFKFHLFERYDDDRERYIRVIDLRKHDAPQHYVFLYDREQNITEEESEAIPEGGKKLGYYYAYGFECTSVEMFCDVFKSMPSEFNLLLLDNNEKLFHSNEAIPNVISL